MRRSGFKSKAQALEPRDPDRIRATPTVTAGAFRAPLPIESVAGVPKTVAHRNPHLLAMARDKPCLLCQMQGIAICTPGSTVAAHSNWSRHGKSMARKADDCYSAWLGDVHHRWLDQGDGTADEREAAFDAAHALQIQMWREIAASPGSAPKDAEAARWALDVLGLKTALTPATDSA